MEKARSCVRRDRGVYRSEEEEGGRRMQVRTHSLISIHLQQHNYILCVCVCRSWRGEILYMLYIIKFILFTGPVIKVSSDLCPVRGNARKRKLCGGYVTLKCSRRSTSHCKAKDANIYRVTEDTLSWKKPVDNYVELAIVYWPSSIGLRVLAFVYWPIEY